MRNPRKNFAVGLDCTEPATLRISRMRFCSRAIGCDAGDAFSSSSRRPWGRHARILACVSLGRPRAQPLARNTASATRVPRPPRGPLQAGLQKLSKLAMVSHIAAKDEATIFMDNEDGVGPSPVAPMNFTVQAVDDNWKLDLLQSLQVARVTQLLLPGAMGRIIFRRVRLSGVE